MIGVFGAGGFIGSALLRRLASRGHPIRAVGRKFNAEFRSYFPASIEFVEADLRDAEKAGSSLEGLDTVVYLIGSSAPSAQNKKIIADLQEELIPHLAFIQTALQRGVRRFLFASSGGAIYGTDVPEPVTEDSSLAPICSYGLIKLTIENYLQMHRRIDGLGAVILRFGNVYGPGQCFRRGQGLIPAVFHCVFQGIPLQLRAGGQAIRDYVFIEDTIDALEEALVNESATGQILNIGSGKGHTSLEVVEKLENSLGAPVPRVMVPDHPTDIKVNILNIEKAARILGWKPRTELAEGLHRTVQWWRSEQRQDV